MRQAVKDRDNRIDEAGWLSVRVRQAPNVGKAAMMFMSESGSKVLGRTRDFLSIFFSIGEVRR